jgi:hypothetical protein
MEHQHLAKRPNQDQMFVAPHDEFCEGGTLTFGHRGIQQMICLGAAGAAAEQVRARDDAW